MRATSATSGAGVRRGGGAGATTNAPDARTNTRDTSHGDDGDGQDAGTALEQAWRAITCDAELTLEVADGASAWTDARIGAAIAAVMHGAAACARRELVVEVLADGTVRIHDDGGPPSPHLGVLAATARDALRSLGADLDVSASDRLVGRVTTIHPAPTSEG